MKKLPLFLATAMLLPSGVYAAAQQGGLVPHTTPAHTETINSTEMDKTLIAKLKKQFSISNDYKKFTVQKNTGGYGAIFSDSENFLAKLLQQKIFYTYTWEDEHLGTITIQTDKDARVLSYQFSAPFNQKKSSAAVDLSKKSVVSNVTAFINNIAPKELENYTLTDYKVNPQEKTAQLTYTKTIQSIPFPLDTIRVAYDFHTKSVTQFSQNADTQFALNYLSEQQISTPKEPITMEQSKEFFQKQEPLTLAYLPVGETAKPVYAREEIKPVDAKDGSLVEPFLSLGSTARAKSTMEYAPSTVEEQELGQVKGLAPVSKAKQLASELLGKDAKFQELSLYKSKEEYFYRLLYKRATDSDYCSSITVNAKTLDISFIESSAENNPKELSLDDKEVQSIVKNFVSRYTKSQGEVDLSKMVITKDHGSIYVTVPRAFDNIPVLYDHLGFTIDPVAKRVCRYYRNFQPLHIEKTNNILSQQDANQKFLQSHLWRKQYILTKENVRLAYASSQEGGIFVDAKTGDLLTSNGEVMTFREPITYPDLTTCKYQKEVLLLSEMGIGLSGHKLSDSITNEEGIHLLGQLNGISPRLYDDIKSSAAEYHLENLADKPKEVMIRGNFLKGMITQKLGEQWNTIDGIFRKDLFDDQSSLGEFEKVFIYGKGLSIVDDTHAKPKDNLSLEDALHWIFNAIHS